MLESDSGAGCYCWTRWGRVGDRGQSSLSGPLPAAAAAKAQFQAKYRDKTKNVWEQRSDFVSHPGKYSQQQRPATALLAAAHGTSVTFFSLPSCVLRWPALIERDYSMDEDDGQTAAAGEEDEKGESKEAQQPKQSALDPRVQSLVSLICDVGMMKAQMLECGYDANKLPLGKLSKDHIKKGYAVLKQLADVLDSDNASRSQLEQLSNASAHCHTLPALPASRPALTVGSGCPAVPAQVLHADSSRGGAAAA